MIPKHHPIQAYTKATHTVAKTRQVVMLYDGAIRFLKQAAEAMVANEIEERFRKLTRASEVISGLQNSLDFELGGQTAQVLYDFYSSIDHRILTLHRQPDGAVCEQLVRELKEMRDVWDAIDRAKDGANATASVPPEPSGPVATTTPEPVPSTVKVSA